MFKKPQTCIRVHNLVAFRIAGGVLVGARLPWKRQQLAYRRAGLRAPRCQTVGITRIKGWRWSRRVVQQGASAVACGILAKEGSIRTRLVPGGRRSPSSREDAAKPWSRAWEVVLFHANFSAGEVQLKKAEGGSVSLVIWVRVKAALIFLARD